MKYPQMQRERETGEFECWVLPVSLFQTGLKKKSLKYFTTQLLCAHSFLRLNGTMKPTYCSHEQPPLPIRKVKVYMGAPLPFTFANDQELVWALFHFPTFFVREAPTFHPHRRFI